MAAVEVLNACVQSQWTLASRLFDADPVGSILVRDRVRSTLLHEACSKNAPFAFVQKLLQAGMDANAQNISLRTALHYANQPQCSASVVSLLLQHGANPNLADKTGKTALHWAAVENVSVDIFRLLVAARGELGRRDDDGKTPLHLAVEHGAGPALLHELVLFSSPSSINQLDGEGHTPLNTALLLSAPPSTVQLLLQHGATIDRQRMRVARFHGDANLVQQVQRAQVLVALCTPGTLLATNNNNNGRRSTLELLPRELLRELQSYLFTDQV